MQRLLTMLVVLHDPEGTLQRFSGPTREGYKLYVVRTTELRKHSVLGALVRLGAVHVGELDEDEGGPT